MIYVSGELGQHAHKFIYYVHRSKKKPPNKKQLKNPKMRQIYANKEYS